MADAPPAQDVVVVLMTAPDGEVAARIGTALVQEGLAACVNIVSNVRSLYVFEGKTCDDSEVLCLIKAPRRSFAALRDRIGALHPYQVPEIIALSPTEGNAPYLAWVLAAGR